MLLHRLSGGCHIAGGDCLKDILMLGGGLSRTVGAYKHSLEAFEQWLGPVLPQFGDNHFIGRVSARSGDLDVKQAIPLSIVFRGGRRCRRLQVQRSAHANEILLPMIGGCQFRDPRLDPSSRLHDLYGPDIRFGRILCRRTLRAQQYLDPMALSDRDATCHLKGNKGLAY